MISGGQVSTFAGAVPQQGPTSGDRPGPLKQAKFNSPAGICIGQAESLYLADSENYKIHILSGGFVVKHAGGSYGEADGAALQAGFRAPTRLALDSGGNIYVTDTSNHLLRKVYTDSLSIRRVTTLAGTRPGSGSPAGGYANGKGTESKFHTPYGVAVDGKGTVYVADRDNHLIRKVSADGTVTTFAVYGASRPMPRTYLPGIHREIPLAVCVDGDDPVRYPTPPNWHNQSPRVPRAFEAARERKKPGGSACDGGGSGEPAAGAAATALDAPTAGARLVDSLLDTAKQDTSLLTCERPDPGGRLRPGRPAGERRAWRDAEPFRPVAAGAARSAQCW